MGITVQPLIMIAIPMTNLAFYAAQRTIWLSSSTVITTVVTATKEAAIKAVATFAIQEVIAAISALS